MIGRCNGVRLCRKCIVLIIKCRGLVESVLLIDRGLRLERSCAGETRGSGSERPVIPAKGFEEGLRVCLAISLDVSWSCRLEIVEMSQRSADCSYV